MGNFSIKIKKDMVNSPKKDTNSTGGTRTRTYTCSHCKKRWLPSSTGKRHNKATCSQVDDGSDDIMLKKAIKLSLELICKSYDKCTICLSDTSDFKTKCGHCFCKGCIKYWCDQFESKTLQPGCPNCKRIIHKNDLEKIGAKKKIVHLRQPTDDGDDSGDDSFDAVWD